MTKMGRIKISLFYFFMTLESINSFLFIVLVAQDYFDLQICKTIVRFLNSIRGKKPFLHARKNSAKEFYPLIHKI